MLLILLTLIFAVVIKVAFIVLASIVVAVMEFVVILFPKMDTEDMVLVMTWPVGVTGLPAKYVLIFPAVK